MKFLNLYRAVLIHVRWVWGAVNAGNVLSCHVIYVLDSQPLLRNFANYKRND